MSEFWTISEDSDNTADFRKQRRDFLRGGLPEEPRVSKEGLPVNPRVSNVFPVNPYFSEEEPEIHVISLHFFHDQMILVLQD